MVTSLIMVILLIYKPKYTFPGLIIVLLGIPVYYIWRKFSSGYPLEVEDGEDTAE